MSAEPNSDDLEAALGRGLPRDEFDARVFLGELRSRLFGDSRTELVAGRYRLRESLGRGGAGIVYCAHDPQLHRDVALKVLRSDHGAAQAVLLAEARHLATLSHPNIVRVFDIGVMEVSPLAERAVYLVMELVQGTTLRRWLGASPPAAQRRSGAETVAVLVAAGRGLAAAHEAGILHGDVKPENILIGEDLRVLLVDFGLARSDGGESKGPGSPTDSPATDLLGGTPGYMAPELLGAPTARGDQFAFCLTAWECLTGARPRVDASGRLVLEREVLVPRRIRAALRRGMSPDPRLRWPSVDALLGHLSPRPRLGRWGWLAAGVLVAGGLAGWSVLWGKDAPTEPSQCEALQRRMDQVWRGAGLDAAMIPAGVRSGVEQWHADWQAELADACGGELSSETRSARLACLEGQAIRLGVQLDDVHDAGPRELASRVDGLGRLDAPRACASAATPCDPEVEGAGAAQIDVLIARGDFAPARAKAGAAVGAAARGPLVCQAKAALRRGRVEMAAHDLSAAQEDFEHAAGIAGGRRAEEQEVLGLAAIALIDLLGRRSARTEDARRWGRRVLNDLPSGHRLRPYVECQLAGVDARDGLWKEAKDHANRCIVGLESTGRASEWQVADGYMLLQLAEESLGNIDASLAAGERSIAVWEAGQGPDHPGLITPLNNLAACFDNLGRREDARALVERALQIAQDRLGLEHPSAIEPLTNLGVFALARNDVDAAVAYLEQAWSIARTQFEPGHPDAALTRCRLAYALLDGKPSVADGARAHVEAALEVVERELPEGHFERLWCELVMVRALAHEQQWERAQAHSDRLAEKISALDEEPRDSLEAEFAEVRARINANRSPSPR